MISIETIEVAGFAAAVKALRLPFGLECRSDVRTAFGGYEEEFHEFFSRSAVTFHPKDLHLMSVLIKRGDEHAKCIRGIVAHAEIDAPLYFWSELETYRAGHERLASASTMHIDCKGLRGEELVKAKEAIPSGKMLKKVDMFSYQCLRKIVQQRTGHRLPHWEKFIDWIHTLPFAEQLIFVGLNEKSDDNN